MNIHTLIPLLLTPLLTVLPSSGGEIDLEKPSSKLRRFTSDVIFVVEAGDRERYSKRLPEFISVHFHGQPGLKPIVEKHLSDFCHITGVKKMEEGAHNQTAAKIDFHFGPQAELAKKAKDMERKITLERGITYWTWWDDKNTINRSVILIATDKLAGAALEDKLIEQLLGVFGLPARSKEFDQSCLSSKEQVLTSLQPLDKAILGFYYRAVPAGTRPQEVDTIFRDQWSKKR
jgi:hypothetical protein